MRGIKSTFIFALIVLAVGGLALYEYKKELKDEEQKFSQDHLYRDLSAERVQSFSYKSSDLNYELKKTEHWEVIKPVTDRADDSVVTSTLRNLFTQNVEVVDAGGAEVNWSQYGLDQPLGVFSFQLSDGPEHRLSVGRVRSYDQGFYLKKENEPHLYVAGRALESLINKAVNEYRSRSIIFPEGDVAQLRIRSRLPNRSVDLTLGKAGESWLYTKDKAIKIDNTSVRDFISALRSFKGDAILEDGRAPVILKKHGLSRPSLTIEAVFSQAKEEVKKNESGSAEMKTVELNFGFTDAPQAALMASLNKPLYAVSKTRAEDLAKDLLHFRNKNYLFKYDQNLAQSFKIRKSGQKTAQEFKMTGGLWGDASGAIQGVNQAEVQALLGGLTQLAAIDFVNAKADEKSLENEVTVFDGKGETVFSLVFGKPKKTDKNGEVYTVKTNLAKEWVHVSRSSIDNLVNKEFVKKAQ